MWRNVGFALLFCALPVVAAEWKVESTRRELAEVTRVGVLAMSDSNLTLKFPYEGENYGQITIRKDTGKRAEVLVLIKRGQMLCQSSQPCHVLVKFDEKPVMKFAGVGPSDGSRNVAFLQPAEKFLKNANGASRIVVGFDVYQNGLQMLEFNFGLPLRFPKATH